LRSAFFRGVVELAGAIAVALILFTNRSGIGSARGTGLFVYRFASARVALALLGALARLASARAIGEVSRDATTGARAIAARRTLRVDRISAFFADRVGVFLARAAAVAEPLFFAHARSVSALLVFA
jgi:hypothetical protein